MLINPEQQQPEPTPEPSTTRPLEINYAVEAASPQGVWISLQEQKEFPEFGTVSNMFLPINLPELTRPQRVELAMNYIQQTYKLQPQQLLPLDTAMERSNILKINDFYQTNDNWKQSIRDFINSIKRIGQFKYADDRGYEVTYHANILITEVSNVSIKIPTTYRDIQTDEINWDYQYILYPMNTFLERYSWNKELLSKLKQDHNINLPFEDGFTPAPFSGFSPLRLEKSWEDFCAASLNTKAIINIIRDRMLDKDYANSYYNIYQHSRMAKHDKKDYIEVRYDSPTKELTFPAYLKELGLDQQQVKEAIGSSAYKHFLSQLEEKLPPALVEPLSLYCNNYYQSPTYLMNLYEHLEKIREQYRQEMFLYNFYILTNFDNLYDQINTFTTGALGAANQYDYRYSHEQKVCLKLKHKISKKSIKYENTNNSLIQQLQGLNYDDDLDW